MQQKCVLLIGDYGHRDFREAVAWLSKNTRLMVAERVDSALASLQSEGLPDVTIFVQSSPGQLSHQQIEDLHAAAPLSRLVSLLGSWCEGETRTGHPWPGVIRIFWHQWQARLLPELLGHTSAKTSLWHLPRTATPSEHFERAALVDWPARRGLIAIHAQTAHAYYGLRDVCLLGGYASVWISPAQQARTSGAVAVLWDSISCDPGEARQLQQLVRDFGPLPVIALLDFLRREDYDQVLAAGATWALAKPFLVNDLLWHLDDSFRHRDDPSHPHERSTTVPSAA